MKEIIDRIVSKLFRSPVNTLILWRYIKKVIKSFLIELSLWVFSIIPVAIIIGVTHKVNIPLDAGIILGMVILAYIGMEAYKDHKEVIAGRRKFEGYNF